MRRRIYNNGVYLYDAELTTACEAIRPWLEFRVDTDLNETP